MLFLVKSINSLPEDIFFALVPVIGGDGDEVEPRGPPKVFRTNRPLGFGGIGGRCMVRTPTRPGLLLK